MARRFAAAIKQGVAWDTPKPAEPQKYQPTMFFFYGTLKDPSTLAAVLDLQELPSLSSATIVGYETKSYGELLVLVTSAGKSVSGVASTIQSIEQEERLRQYEGNLYRVRPCWINIGNDKVVGKTFVYNGKMSDFE